MFKSVLALLLLINLNTATVRELQALPGIGPVLAQRIVEFREKLGGYRRVEDLLAVPGIGERLWRRIRDQVEAPEEDREKSEQVR